MPMGQYSLADRFSGGAAMLVERLSEQDPPLRLAAFAPSR